MKYTALHRFTAGLVFSISLVQYFCTLQPSVALWDPGELSAAAHGLQISHPPGAPLFSLLGRVFFMLPFPGNIGLRLNALSAISSALAVLLLYLVAVKLIDLYKRHPPNSLVDAIGTYISAAVGALALSFSDTMWFNAVESNVFGLALFFFALITWLALHWYQQTDSQGNLRYILLIAYIGGLAIGVQVMSILSLVIVGMFFIYERTGDEEGNQKRTAIIFLGHILILIAAASGMWAIETTQMPPTQEELVRYDITFLLLIASISLAVMFIFKKKVFRMDSFYAAIASGGIAIALLFVGVMKVLPAAFQLPTGNSNIAGLILLFAVLVVFYIVTKWARKNEKEILAIFLFSTIFAIIGFSIYVVVIIRANQHVHLNEGSPGTISRLAPYLNRDQYGEWPLFKRRWSVEPQYHSTWTNYTSDLDFFGKYQMNKMFSQYLFWNFIGRATWVKDASVNWNQLYGIPLFLGVIGLAVHFRRNWKIASAFMILFILSGFLISFYGNMQDPQPRDRDYYYTGAFFVFALWIALGFRGILDLIEAKISPRSNLGKIVFGSVLCLGVIVIPGRMLQTNYFTHDRSRNWLPRDYAYNTLQSCEPNSILFTNGDNDTFPIWYLQEVEGVRTDVRVVSLALANANWYIKQLKHERFADSPEIKISLADDAIENIQPVEWKDRIITLGVPPDVIAKYGVTDTSVIHSSALCFTMPATLRGKEMSIIKVQDVVVKDIIEQNHWERPIYFAVTTALDARIGLGPYLRLEGMALEVVPQKNPVHSDRVYYVDEPVMRKNFLRDASVHYDRMYKPGFIFTGLNDKSIYFDDTQRQLIQNYRGSLFSLAFYYMYQAGDKNLCKQTIDRMEEILPRDLFKMDVKLSYYLTMLYYNVGDTVKFQQVSSDAEKLIREGISEPGKTRDEYVKSYSMLTEIYDRTHEYEKAIGVIEELLVKFPDDHDLLNELANYKRMAEQLKQMELRRRQ